MTAGDLSEYRVKPALLIAHDPTEFGAFQGFASCRSESLLTTFLFRAHPNVGALREQHRNFVAALGKRLRVAYLGEILGTSKLGLYKDRFAANPNYLFTHDALITLPWIPDGYILGRMRKEPRMGEPAVMETVARVLGLKEIVKIPSGLFLEGGDVIPICLDGRRLLLVGYGPRSLKETLHFLRDALVQDGTVDEVVGFELAPWRLNLDGCFFPVRHDVAVAQRDSIAGGLLLGRGYTEAVEPLDYFEKKGFTILEATKEESYLRQACNFACLGDGAFVAYDMTERINDALRAGGSEIISVPGTELVKGNGGPHCMTRPIYKIC